MFLKALNIPGSGLTAEQYRLNLIAQNISNVETTRTEKSTPDNPVPYKRKMPVYQEMTGDKTGGKFSDYLGKALHTRTNIFSQTGGGSAITAGTGRRFSDWKKPGGSAYDGAMGGVKIPKIIEDPTPGKMVYDPEHPDANEEGYVEYPNVEMVQEMINMMGAGRSYEANLQVVNAMKAMATKALEIGR